MYAKDPFFKNTFWKNGFRRFILTKHDFRGKVLVGGFYRWN